MIRSVLAVVGMMIAGPVVAQTTTGTTYVEPNYAVDLNSGYAGAPLPDYSDAEFLNNAAGFVCRPADGSGGEYWTGGTVGQAYGGGTVVAPPVYAPTPPPVYVPTPPPVYDPAPPVGFGLAGTSWRVVEINGAAASATHILNFTSATGFGGRAACNTYGGELTTGAGLSIRFGNIFATRAACPALSEEQAYLGALGQARAYRVGREGDGLALLNAQGVTIVKFVPANGTPPQPMIDLTGNWRVIGIQTETGFDNSSPELAGLSFSFDGAGRFRANGGCNDFLGEYSQNGGSLQFGMIAMTARQCFAPAPFEGDVGRNLSIVRGVRGGGGQIDLVDAGGEPLFALTR